MNCQKRVSAAAALHADSKDDWATPTYPIKQQKGQLKLLGILESNRRAHEAASTN
jgi:hypothetical protein